MILIACSSHLHRPGAAARPNASSVLFLNLDAAHATVEEILERDLIECGICLKLVTPLEIGKLKLTLFKHT